MSMSINQLIINFHSILVSSWPSMSKILEHLDWDESPYFLNDWMQANWELMVEKQALGQGQFLAPYGYDSSAGSRYTYKDCKLTHQVTCKKKGKPTSQYYFLCFVSKLDGAFKIEPPFDFIDVVHIETKDILTLALEEVEFSIVPIV